MQEGVSCPISRGTCSRGLTTFSKVLRLSTERPLIYPTRVISRKRQTHMLDFKHCLGTRLTHILYGFLITYIIGAFYGVIHMPLPLIIWILTCNRASNSPLSRHGMRSRRKHLRNHSSIIARLS